MGHKLWFGFGLSVLAAITGFLVGASHSPVAGVAITAGFGLAVPLASLLNRRAEQPPAGGSLGDSGSTGFLFADPRQLAILGKILLIFCITFAVGLVGGAYSRVNDWPHAHTTPQNFPWDKDHPPQSAYDAVDWIVVQARLRALGYTDEQIHQLYSLPKGSSALLYSTPLSSLFMGLPSPAGSMGGAVATEVPRDKKSGGQT